MAKQAIILYHNMTQEDAIKAGTSIGSLDCSKTVPVNFPCNKEGLESWVDRANRALSETAGPEVDRIILVFRRDQELIEYLKNFSCKLKSQQYQFAGFPVWVANEIRWPVISGITPLRGWR